MSDDRSSKEERAEGGELGNLDRALEEQTYPVTADELTAAYGEYEVQSEGGTQSIEEVLQSIDDESFESADEVRTQLLEQLRRE